VLRDYAQRLGIQDARQWHFVTAPRDTIFRLAGQYMAAVERDDKAPGGAVHNGAFALVDPNGHVRGLYDGVNSQEVDRLLKELPILLEEVAPAKATAAK
jgi:protein SCO1/2